MESLNRGGGARTSVSLHAALEALQLASLFLGEALLGQKLSSRFFTSELFSEDRFLFMLALFFERESARSGGFFLDG